MISINDIHHVETPTPTYRVRREAEAAAMLVLGPLAIREFDFVTFQLDNGRWDWDVPAAERPLSAAVIKANGGKKFLLARAKQQGTAMAKTDNTTIAPACNGLDIKPHDDLDIPDFLKRPDAKAAAKPSPTAIVTGTDMSNRAARRARRKAQDETSADPMADSHKSAKRTSDRPTKTAAHPTKNQLVVELLRRPEGCTAEDARAITGWASVSISKQATIAGIKLKKVKQDGITHYWAR